MSGVITRKDKNMYGVTAPWKIELIGHFFFWGGGGGVGRVGFPFL